jgi:hypothetical protein
MAAPSPRYAQATTSRTLRSTMRSRNRLTTKDDPTKLRSQGYPEVAILHARLVNAKEQASRAKEQHGAEARRRAELELVVKAHRRAAKADSPRPDVLAAGGVAAGFRGGGGGGGGGYGGAAPFSMPALRLNSASPLALSLSRVDAGDHGHTAQLAFSKLQAEEVSFLYLPLDFTRILLTV